MQIVDTDKYEYIMTYSFPCQDLYSAGEGAEMEKGCGTRKRKIQAYVNSLKLSAVQKYMVMGYLGFSNLNGEMQVKAYINRLSSLTTTEKAKLLEYSGYAA